MKTEHASFLFSAPAVGKSLIDRWTRFALWSAIVVLGCGLANCCLVNNVIAATATYFAPAPIKWRTDHHNFFVFDSPAEACNDKYAEPQNLGYFTLDHINAVAWYRNQYPLSPVQCFAFFKLDNAVVASYFVINGLICGPGGTPRPDLQACEYPDTTPDTTRAPGPCAGCNGTPATSNPINI
jgi:hypothetical protein